MSAPTPSPSSPIHGTELPETIRLLGQAAADLRNHDCDRPAECRAGAALFDRLASALPALLQDAERWRWLASRPALVVTLPAHDGSVGADHYVTTGQGIERARQDVDALIAGNSAAPEPETPEGSR